MDEFFYNRGIDCMVLFYAWSNTILINMLNAKINCFKEEKVDLLIRCSPTLSREFVDEIKSSGVFENVYFIDMPRMNKNRGVFGKIPKLKMFGMKKAIKNYYIRYARENFAEKNYTCLLTGGMWNDTIFLLDALGRYNRNIKVEFIEEGERSYEGIESIQVTVVVANWKERIIKKYNEGSLKRKYKRNISNRLYLYKPERYEEKFRDTLIKLPQILEESNGKCFSILKKVADRLGDTHLLYYEKRKVYYFANYLIPKYEPTYNTAYSIIDVLIKRMGKNRIVIKPHSSSTEHRLNFAEEYEKEVFVDRDNFLFEVLYTKLNVNDKVFVAKSSTSLLYPMQLFGQEPYLIFTYKLFDYYHQYEDEITEKYVNDLRAMYTSPEKIFVPNTMMELENQINIIYQKIMGNI